MSRAPMPPPPPPWPPTAPKRVGWTLHGGGSPGWIYPFLSALWWAVLVINIAAANWLQLPECVAILLLISHARYWRNQATGDANER